MIITNNNVLRNDPIIFILKFLLSLSHSNNQSCNMRQIVVFLSSYAISATIKERSKVIFETRQRTIINILIDKEIYILLYLCIKVYSCIFYKYKVYVMYVLSNIIVPTLFYVMFI